MFLEPYYIENDIENQYCVTNSDNHWWSSTVGFLALRRWGWGCSMQRDLVLLPIRRTKYPLVRCFRQMP